MTDTFITQRKLTIFSFFASLIMMFTTFGTPFLQLGSVINAQDIPDSYAAEEPEAPIIPEEPEILADTTSPISNFRILDTELNEVETVEFPQFKIEYSAEDLRIEGQETAGVSHIRVTENLDITSGQWIEYAGGVVVESREFVNGESSKTFYFQSKDLAGNESEVIQKTINLKLFDIVSELETSAEEILIGDSGVVKLKLINLGTDIAYNAFVKIDLPKGFSYLPPDLSSNVEGEDIIPSEINTDDEGNQYLIYQSIADLLPGEEVSVEINLQIPGQTDGYEIGQIVQIPVLTELFAYSDFAIGYKTEGYIEVELKPIRVNLESNTGQEVLVGEEYENKITVETNPEVPTISEEEGVFDEISETITTFIEPLVVLFKLDNAEKYKQGSQRVFINGEEVSLEEYNILFEEAIDLYNSNPILKWVFNGQVDPDTIIEIFFGVEVDKYDSDSLIPDYTEHGDNLESPLEVHSGFENKEGQVVQFTENEIQNIKAKYFTVDKYITDQSNHYNLGDTVTYTVEVQTSKFYNLSGVTIEDILPDGVNINEELIIKNEKLIVNDDLVDESIIQNYIDSIVANERGETIIKWNIVEIPAGAKYTFQYEVTLEESYDFKSLEGNSLISSADQFGSSVEITGMWSDVDENTIRTGADENDSNEQSFKTEKVKYKNGIKLEEYDEFSSSVYVRTGDIVNIRSEVTFPEHVPTNNYEARIYIPVGTNLVGSPEISYFGTFENSPESIQLLSTIGSLENPNYLYLNLGDVHKGSSYTITYSLEIRDDSNLKLATQVRNLFRSTYLNIDSEKITDRTEVSLVLIEPKIEVTKRKVSGYVAAGEEFSVETVIKNAGTSTAYGLSIGDSILTNTTLLEDSYELIANSNLGNTFTVEYDEGSSSFLIQHFNLEPDEFITLSYRLLADSYLLYNDRLDSTVTVSEYANRSAEDVKPARIFEENTYDFKWWAKESLLATNVKSYNSNGSELSKSTFGKYEIGRDFEFTVDFSTEVVGQAPVYNTTINSQLVISNEYDLNILDYRVLLNNEELIISNEKISIHGDDTDVTFDSDTGEVNVSGIAKLYPGDVITIIYELKTPKYIIFDLLYSGEITALGENALAEKIRKDGSYQTGRDYDDNDHSEVSFITAKIDDDAPTGDISFIINDEYVYATNHDSVDSIEYRAFDQSQVVGVRFSNNSGDWYVIDTEGEQALAILQPEIIDILGIDGDWNMWEVNPLLNTHNSELPAEGKNYRYMQLVDLYGNIATIENYIIKDTVAPSIADVVISPFQGDLSDPIYTGTSENYVHFFSVDDNHLSDGTETDEYSGVGWYRFASESTQLNDADWNYMLPGVNSFEFDWGEVQDLDELKIYLQIKDLAGNLYEGDSVESCFGVEILNQVQDTGHIICDDIIFTTDIPEISINLNDGDSYTNNAIVNLGLEITESTSGVQNIKFNDEEWQAYSESITEYVLPESWNTGDKELCVQVEDAARARSNIACDSIIFDPTAPEGAISIESEVVTQTNIELDIEAADPKLDDGTDGIGNIQMRFSEIGRDCELIMKPFDFPQGDTSEFEECESSWLGWEDFSSAKDWQLNETGLNYVYVQFKDGIDNLSEIYRTTVIYNPFAGEGDILINNDEIFTNEELVNLDLSLNCTFLLEGVEGFCDQSPVLMRLVTTSEDQTAEIPPIWNTREEYELWYENNDGGLLTDPLVEDGLPTVASGEGWSYWTEYQSSIQWHLLGGNNTIFDESNDPESPYSEDFGKKNVFIQYLFADGSVSELQTDSIVYAPFYGVEYYPVGNEDLHSLPNDTYTINTVPDSLLTQDSIIVKLNAKNIGSFTWSPYTVGTGESEVQPVKISYRWKAISTEADGVVPEEYRGNSAILPENISWNEETGELELIIDTPLFPGEYELVIDTIHEGVAWFSDFGNDVLSYQISIDQNPDKDPQPLGSSIPDEEGAIGAGGVCYAGGTNSFRGIFKTAPAGWPGPYYIDVDGNGASSSDGFFYGFTQFLGQEVIADVVYRDANCVFATINMYAAPKTWRSTWDSNVGSNSIYNSTIHIKRGESINFNLVFRNDGTGVWERSKVFMHASSTGSRTLTTNFDRSNYRVEMYTGYNSVGQGGGGLFQAHIEIPSDQAVGLYSLCYRLSDNQGYSWERNDTKCINVQVELNSADQQELRCAEPHNVYEESNIDSNIITTLNQNDLIVVVEEIVIGTTPWMRVAHPTNPTADAWVNNSDDCFDFITNIDNPIQAPDIPEPKTPTGDTGVIIAIDGLDVRHGPSPLFPIKDTIPYDSEVRVIGQITLPFGYGHWLKIEYVDGNGVKQEGWVSDGFVAHVNNPSVIQFNITPPFVQSHTCSSVDARSLPGNQFPVVKSLSGNFNTNIIARWDAGQLGGSGVWYQIYLDSSGRSVGWVPESAMCQGYWSPPPAANVSVEGISTGNGGGFYNGVLYQYPLYSPYVITGKLYDYRPVGGGSHNGIDYARYCGSMIMNAADGKIKNVVSGYPEGAYPTVPKVTRAEDPEIWKKYDQLVNYFAGRANFIEIEHYNGTITRYVHMQDVWFTKADIGKHVNRGQGLGTVGTSGLSSGCHLHLTFFDSNGDIRSFEDIMQGSLDSKINSIQKFLDTKTTSYHLFQDSRDNFRQYGNCSATYREVKWAELKDLESTWRSGYAFYSPAVNTTIFVKNSILDEYLGISGPCGVLGYPKYSSGWIKGKKYINHYSEVEALPSKFGTSGWYQQFKNGQIYFNDRTNDSYHIFGEIYDDFKILGGTWGAYGFPVSDRYWVDETKQYCQNFEGGALCSTPEGDNGDLFLGVENQLVEVEYEIDGIENALKAFIGDVGKLSEAIILLSGSMIPPVLLYNLFSGNLNNLAHFVYGLGIGAIQGGVDFVNFITDVFTNPLGTLKEIFETIIGFIKDPSVLAVLIIDFLDEYEDKNRPERLQMLGEALGQFIPDVILALVGGSGIVKSASKALDLVKDFSHNAINILRLEKIANTVRDIRVVGVLLKGVKFGENASIKVADLVNSLKVLSIENTLKIIDSMPLSLRQKAYILHNTVFKKFSTKYGEFASKTSHVSERMVKRGFSYNDVVRVINEGESFKYFHEGIWKTGYYEAATKSFIATGSNQKIYTVIDDVSRRYINNLRR